MEKLPTINIKGKEYVLVKDRILSFNEEHKNGSIVTEILSSIDAKRIIIKATVTPDVTNQSRKFTGFSQAEYGGSGVNLTSALENAETSAVGRALAMMGIGVLESVASADEVRKAVAHPRVGEVRQAKVEWQEGDRLVSGTSQKTGKNWYAIQRGKEKVWLQKHQYEYLHGMLADKVIADIQEAAPPPEPPPF